MSNNDYKITEVGQIPLSWNVVEIQDISEVKTGGTPSKSKPEYWGGDIKWMASGDIHLRKVYDVPQRISKLGFENSNVKLLPRKTVMIALNGQGKTRGTVAILETELTCNQSLAGFTPSDKFVPEFLYYNLQNRYSEIRNLTGDGARTGLNLAILREIKVALPSVYEQRKIAAILSSIDEAINKTEAIIAQTEKVKKGLMQQLFTKGIGHTKFKKTDIGEIPEKWEVVTIEDCCDILDNRRVPLSKKVRETMRGKVPYYGATGIVDYINDYLFDEEIVLIGEDGDHFKKFRDWSMTNLVKGKSWVNNHAHILRAKTSVTNQWIFRFLEHRDITPYLSIQGATRLKLTQQNLRQIKIAVPSKEEQEQVTTIIAIVDKKKKMELKRLVQLRDVKKGIMKSLLTGKVRVKVDEAEVTQV